MFFFRSLSSNEYRKFKFSKHVLENTMYCIHDIPPLDWYNYFSKHELLFLMISWSVSLHIRKLRHISRPAQKKAIFEIIFRVGRVFGSKRSISSVAQQMTIVGITPVNPVMEFTCLKTWSNIFHIPICVTFYEPLCVGRFR